MKRTTIMAPEGLLERLHRLADQRGVSFAVVVREALEDKAESFLPPPRSTGMFDSGRSDGSEVASAGRVPPRSWR